MTGEIEGLLDGTDKRAGFAPNAATTFVERFMAGHMIDVADEIKVRADLEKLVGLDEAWSLCLRTPPPGWRFLGRFVDDGMFVATVAQDRHQLGSVANYTATAQKMIDDWGLNLSSVPFIRRAGVADYPLGVVNHVKAKKKK